MGWFTTSVDLSANAAYNRSKETASTIYQQAQSKIWRNGESPNAGQQQTQLADDMASESDLSAEDRETFGKMSSGQMGEWVADLEHRDRLDLLGNDEFMREYWSKAREGVKNDEALGETFGLDGTQHTKVGQNGKACLHHEHPGPITTVPYTPEITEKAGRSAKRDEKGVAELSPGGQGKVSRKTAESETAKAERTEKRQGTVDVCENDPNNCPTSLNAFYWEAERRSASVQKGSNSTLSERFGTDPTDYIDTESSEEAEIASESDQTEEAETSAETETEPAVSDGSISDRLTGTHPSNGEGTGTTNSEDKDNDNRKGPGGASL